MTVKSIFAQISPVLWEIPKTYRSDMRVPARVFASKKILSQVLGDKSLEQLINVAALPGIQKAAFAMPDVHEGYGFPIGGVAAMSAKDGVISPGGIGYDINCGVRLLKSNLTADELERRQGLLARRLFENVPSGLGRGGAMTLTERQFDDVLSRGAAWVAEQGYGSIADLRFLESNGRMSNADPSCISHQAKQRGRDQLGTLGSGNHFLEVDKVDTIFDSDLAASLGLFPNQMLVMIHCGSRGLGHQVATDYIKDMMKSMSGVGISVPDRQLACAPLSSKLGNDYFNAMAAAANFAWANRQMIAWEVEKVWQEVFSCGLATLYDVAHNIAKLEKHEIAGKVMEVLVHRKGATRAFGPGHPELANDYQDTGQPVLIPGSMGTASYILAGTNEGMEQSFGSVCHGAGRTMSRHEAKKQASGQQLKTELQKQGVTVESGSLSGLAEEAPSAYKDVDEVVDVVSEAGLATKVARLKPLVVIKG